jgi:hypothetical protein
MSYASPLNADDLKRKASELEDEEKRENGEVTESAAEDVQSIRSLFSVQSTPQQRRGISFSTSKAWLAAWLMKIERYRCHATGIAFRPDCPSFIQFAHIHLPRALEKRDKSEEEEKEIDIAVSRISHLASSEPSTASSDGIRPRYGIPNDLAQ